MPRISIGDCSLYYERHGMGFPILFVSGLGGFASFWQDQIAAFAKRFEVVTFDHRGIGQSDEARIGYTVERMAADVVSLMNALEIRRSRSTIPVGWPALCCLLPGQGPMLIFAGFLRSAKRCCSGSGRAPTSNRP